MFYSTLASLLTTCFCVAVIAPSGAAWAQSIDDPLSPRQSRALNQDFDRAFRLRSRDVGDDSVFAFSGSIGAAFERASGGGTSYSLPIEIAASHRPSGVVFTLAPDLHTWLKEDGISARGVGNPSISLLKKWSQLPDTTSALLHISYEAKSGSDVGGPSVSTITGILIQKVNPTMTLRAQATIGQVALGSTLGNSRLVAAAIKTQFKLESPNARVLWAQFKSAKVGSGSHKTTGVLGIDAELTNELSGSLSLSRGLNGNDKVTKFGFDVSYGF
jgi:hypothetical protein